MTIEWYDFKNAKVIDEATREEWVRECVRTVKVNDYRYIASGNSMILVTNSEVDGIDVFDLVVRRHGYTAETDVVETTAATENAAPLDEHKKLQDFFFKS